MRGSINDVWTMETYAIYILSFSPQIAMLIDRNEHIFDSQSNEFKSLDIKILKLTILSL